ncbi:cupin domain-containing protein [Marinivivus vitaminiproducens]|uniref:cupin domain-containing protein n=1 Tax=Marinivivus vitaminiproducens TaxID=3035935 RepID=UPI00279CD9BE|nr:cupin domain-containing protein [Geminicoccaceae bacterium SCSIO 64248]
MATHDTDTYYLFGTLVRFVARSSETGGAYCLTDTLVAPGAGAPPNRHPGDDESFYVLDGTFDFTIEGATTSHGPGAFIRVPTGAVHAFRNTGTAPARLMVINVPGVIHDGFFSEVGTPMPRGTWKLPAGMGGKPDAAKLKELAEIAGRHGLELVMG